MIPIKNLFFILCYSWGRLDEGELVKASVDEVMTPQDLLAKVLINGCNRVLKDGLDRGYLEFAEESSNLRGKINFSGSISRLLFEQAKAATFVDELSHNILPNQILRSTVHLLVNSPSIDPRLRVALSKVARGFREIDLIRLNASIFKRVQIHQNNAFYAFLIDVCELIYFHLSPDSQEGEFKIRDFTRDELKMRKVFQDFAYNFYRTNQMEFDVYSERLSWGANGNQADLSMLPYMYTDVTLNSPHRKIILDTKYYQEAFQSNWGKSSFHSSHLYQLNTYLGCVDRTQNSDQKIDGILLYPATNDEFTFKFDLGEHSITVASIDMRMDSSEISQRMIDILR
jgi:5-methylcytosine-specific restriction enzyme subunit McrC